MKWKIFAYKRKLKSLFSQYCQTFHYPNIITEQINIYFIEFFIILLQYKTYWCSRVKIKITIEIEVDTLRVKEREKVVGDNTELYL